MKRVLLAVLLNVTVQSAAFTLTPLELWQLWPEERFLTVPAPCLRHAELADSLRSLETRHPGRLQLEAVGHSAQGRAIYMLTLGQGPRKVLLWSQMHGDEPSATPALLDIADFLLEHAADPAVADILGELTLLMIPMLNPDGSEVYERRNAQAIDVNRDALSLATPEGQILKRVRDQHRPILGFNLHDQNRRTTVGDTGVLATNAVLAVAGDPEGTVTPGRLLAKRACSAVVAALEPFMPGGMARYDEEWSPRAFGDNITAWGTPVVLIESGGLPPGHSLEDLTRLNFVAILSVLEHLVRDDLAGFDPEVYDTLPRNRSDAWTDVAVREGSVLQPGVATAYRADLTFDLLLDDRDAAGCRAHEPVQSRILEIGDGRFIAAGREVDATGRWLLPPFVAGVRGWSARRWLDREALKHLAELGVGTLRWVVPSRRFAAADALSRRLVAAGGAQLQVVAEPAKLPWLEISRLPPAPAYDSLGEVLRSLVGQRRRQQLEGLPLAQALERLWGLNDTGTAPPPLRPRQPASFLLVAPAAEGKLALMESRLVGVWINGRETAAGDR